LTPPRTIGDVRRAQEAVNAQQSVALIFDSLLGFGIPSRAMSSEALGTGAVGFYFFRTDEEVAVTAQNRDAVLAGSFAS
jgi:hypothetical protein